MLSQHIFLFQHCSYYYALSGVAGGTASHAGEAGTEGREDQSEDQYHQDKANEKCTKGDLWLAIRRGRHWAGDMKYHMLQEVVRSFLSDPKKVRCIVVAVQKHKRSMNNIKLGNCAVLVSSSISLTRFCMTAVWYNSTTGQKKELYAYVILMGSQVVMHRCIHKVAWDQCWSSRK